MTVLRDKLEQWRTAMHHPSRELLATGTNTARLPELEVLLTEIVDRLDHREFCPARQRPGSPCTCGKTP